MTILTVTATDGLGLQGEKELEIPYSTVRGMAAPDLGPLTANKVSIIRVFMDNCSKSWVNDPKCKLAWENGGFPVISFRNVADWKKADLDLFLDRCIELRNAKRQAVLCFNHEPEDDKKLGTPTDFKARFKDYVTNQRGLVPDLQVRWALVMMGWTFDKRSGRNPLDWYPGDDFVDFVGADVYDWAQFHKQNHQPLSQITQPALSFAKAHDKLLMVTEYGIAPYEHPMDRVNAELEFYRWCNDNRVPLMCYYNRADPRDATINWTLKPEEASNIFFKPKGV